jgi:carboxylesterase
LWGVLSDVQELARPFSLGPEHALRGALVVHGFTGTPFEVRGLGEALAARGFAVEGPRLAGHAGSTADLQASRWPDWVASAERALEALGQRCRRVAVCGLSMGALVALELARRHPKTGEASRASRGASREAVPTGTPVSIEALALLAPALWLPRRAERFDALMASVPFLAGVALPKLAGSDIRDVEMRRKNSIAQGRAGMPLAALHSLVEFGHYLKPRLAEVTQPALLMHGKNDHAIPIACMEYVANALGTPRPWIYPVALERSFHVVTLDVDREQVFRAVGDHFDCFLR